MDGAEAGERNDPNYAGAIGLPKVKHKISEEALLWRIAAILRSIRRIYIQEM